MRISNQVQTTYICKNGSYLVALIHAPMKASWLATQLGAEGGVVANGILFEKNTKIKERNSLQFMIFVVAKVFNRKDPFNITCTTRIKL